MTSIEHHDWERAAADLDQRGWTVLPRLLDRAACADMAALYDRETGFRKEVVMVRNG